MDPDRKNIRIENDCDSGMSIPIDMDDSNLNFNMEPDCKKIKLENDCESGISFPVEMDASDMLDEVELDENGIFPSVTNRYLTPYYQLDIVNPGDDICIRVHTNRICMISLAPSHSIFVENKTIESINYKVSDKLDRLQNKVSGKAKHGAHPLQSNSNLCFIKCTDSSLYPIKCCMVGKLIEVNEALTDDFNLLKKEPHQGGYIAIVMPNLKHLDGMIEKMLNQKQYEKTIAKRKSLEICT